MPLAVLGDFFVSATTKNIITTITILWAAIMGFYLLYNKYKDDFANPNTDEIEKKKLLSRVGLGGVIAIVMNADGRPTKAELEQAKVFLKVHYRREMQIDILHHIKRVLALKRPNTNFYLSQLNLCFDYKKRSLIVDMLYEVASFNGGITPDEWRLLDYMMGYLNITKADQDLFHKRFHTRIGNSRFTEGDTIDTSDNSMNRCYRTLGLRKGASLEDVKRAYRKLALQYHPDRLSGETDPEKISVYTKKFREINEAYEELLEVLD